MLKIGLLIYGSLNSKSGGYLYDRELAAYMSRQGERVEIVSLAWRSYSKHLGDNWHHGFWRLLHSADFDLLLQDELNHPSLFLLNHALRRRVTYPLLSIVHHLRVDEPYHSPALRPIYRAIEQHYLQTVDGFIFNSETTRRAVFALSPHPKPFIVAPPSVGHCPNHLPNQLIVERAQEPTLNLLCVGAITPRKNQLLLLQSMSQLRDLPIYLTLVGDDRADPHYTWRVQQQIAQRNLRQRVRLYGNLPSAELDHLYSHAQIFVLPSLYEGFGIAYLEAMSYGLPCLATPNGAQKELIRHNREGRFFSADDSTALAQHIRELWHNRPLLTQLALAARARFAEMPTWEQTGATIHHFLHTFLTR